MSATPCPACGHANDGAARFCGACGSALAQAPPPIPDDVDVPPLEVAGARGVGRGLAVLALALSGLGGAGTIGAIVLGHRVRRLAARGRDPRGARLALCALAVAYGTVLAAIVVVVYVVSFAD